MKNLAGNIDIQSLKHKLCSADGHDLSALVGNTGGLENHESNCLTGSDKRSE
jgi:hypothetical protein